MENTTYYIYHIPTVKIGVSVNPKSRVSDQGKKGYEILEQHQCIYKVSDREQELQKQYGYKVDTLPYWKTILNQRQDARSKGGVTSGNIAKESGQLASIHHLGGMVSGKLPKYSLRKLDYEKAQYIRTQYARKVDCFGKKITMTRLAKVFDVDYATINRIINNKRYTKP